jgi:predicted nucleic acid-binding Zn ribbon protein
MNCKHRWEPIWEHHTYAYHYQCARCGNIINVIRKGLK